MSLWLNILVWGIIILAVAAAAIKWLSERVK